MDVVRKKRRLSDYNVFVSAALRSASPRTLAEARAALARAADVWRGQRRVPNPAGAVPTGSLSCPGCDARLTIPRGMRTGMCPHCKMRVRVRR